MRTFEHFLRRRGVRDIQSWLTEMKIESDAQLIAWCNTEQLNPPDKKYFKSPQVQKPASSQQATASSPTDPDTSWHIPAAERSRKVRRSKTSKTTSKSTKKTSK